MGTLIITLMGIQSTWVILVEIGKRGKFTTMEEDMEGVQDLQGPKEKWDLLLEITMDLMGIMDRLGGPVMADGVIMPNLVN